jgi:uncharacterized membrane protein
MHMRDGSRIFGFIDNLYFSHTEKGWLFKEPSVWPRRTYLLTDGQKMRLARPVRWMNFVMLIILIAGLQIQGLVTDWLHVSAWFGMAIVVVSAVIVFWIYVALFVRPKLSSLTPTNERITWSRQFKAQATGLSKPLIVVWLVVCLAFVGLGLWMSFIDGWDLKGVASIGFFVILGIYPAALLGTGNLKL